MNVEVSHHIDASDPEADGSYDYYYEYDVYTFSDGSFSYFVRSYVDQPERAAFMSGLKGTRGFHLEARHLRTRLFADAVAYLHLAGKTDLNWLSKRKGDYLPISDLDEPGFARLWRRLQTLLMRKAAK